MAEEQSGTDGVSQLSEFLIQKVNEPQKGAKGSFASFVLFRS
jgi:hypothetical protein